MITSAAKLSDVKVIPTGLVIDRAIGVGGIPRRRPVELTGEPGMGKSTICLQIVAAAQTSGNKCLYVDVEGTFTPQYAEKIGVDMKKLDVYQDRAAEDILETVLGFVEKEAYDLIVIDSLGMLTPRDNFSKPIGEVVMAGQSRLISQFARKLAIALIDKDVAVIAVNHTAIDFETGKEKTRGGKSWNHAKAVRLHISKKYGGKVLKKGDDIIEYTAIVEVREKNKMKGNVGSKYESQFVVDVGFSADADLLREAMERLFTKEGNTYHWNGEKLGTVGKLRELMADESFAAKLKEALT
jgi:recombination protein RecA